MTEIEQLKIENHDLLIQKMALLERLKLVDQQINQNLALLARLDGKGDPVRKKPDASVRRIKKEEPPAS